ncbi:MAG: LON peptidase substrate-binding domain-containing protein [Verrucomicrobiota bacterium]
MKLPSEVPVMILQNATLFPQAMLPLFIFEPRYRRMLSDTLQSHRMFVVAMQQPLATREKPSPIAGLGVIRVAVGHRDGTSHLILQGIARVELEKATRYRPYRVHRIRALETPPCNTVAADALLAKIRELLEERIRLGLPFPPLSGPPEAPAAASPPEAFSSNDILSYLDSISDPERVADLVSYAVLPDASERQLILEALDVETRLRRLIQFMLAEIRRERKGRNG